jgi:hypothetical protein
MKMFRTLALALVMTGMLAGIGMSMSTNAYACHLKCTEWGCHCR